MWERVTEDRPDKHRFIYKGRSTEARENLKNIEKLA